ncbi:hypothetical protein AEP_00868 [Curvibacter sp. AEP1-3]|nr:hypothetical protein AEP_00868 [Curvibacter sp. AEP1-3]
MCPARRRASASEREYAADLVRLYRRAKEQPDGILCVNPEAPPEEQATLDYKDPAVLLSALDRFASQGFFDDWLGGDVKNLLIQEFFNKLRAEGKTHEVAKEETAQKFCISESTVQRALVKSNP